MSPAVIFPINHRLMSDQLMYVPPSTAVEQTELEPLKTILMWGGLAQWGGVKGGR